MAARSTVLIGPVRNDKTLRLLAWYRLALSRGRPGEVLWLAPTGRSATVVRDRLITDCFSACFSPAVMTFERFADAVLEASPTWVHPIGELIQRQLIRRLIDRASQDGRLRHFAPIAATSGFVELVSRFIRECKRLEIWPEHFEEACKAKGETVKDAELAELYAQYQLQLIRHNL